MGTMMSMVVSLRHVTLGSSEAMSASCKCQSRSRLRRTFSWSPVCSGFAASLLPPGRSVPVSLSLGPFSFGDIGSLTHWKCV